MFQQALAQMCQVSIRVARWCYPFINLENVNIAPRDIFSREIS